MRICYFFLTPRSRQETLQRDFAAEESRIEKKEKRVENFRNIVQVLPEFIDNIDNDDYNNDDGLDACDATVKHHRAELAGEAEKHKAQVHEFEYVRILFHENSISCFSSVVI